MTSKLFRWEAGAGPARRTAADRACTV